jgi:hypothetical protein
MSPAEILMMKSLKLIVVLVLAEPKPTATKRMKLQP